MEYLMLEYNSSKKLSAVNMDVFDGANIIASGTSTSNGIIKLSVPAGKKYKVVFSKTGKVSRMLYIDSKGIKSEDIQGGTVVSTGKIEVKLFDEIYGVDFSYVENNPFTEFFFEGNAMLSYNNFIAEKMAKKITDLLKQAAIKESENDAKYQDAMSKAKDWYNKKNYKFALDKFEEAALFKPNEQEPKDRIKELDALLKKQQTEDLVKKQKEEEYQKIIADGNALTQQKKYAEAIAKYQEALKIKDEQYVRDQIKDLNGFLDKAKKDEEIEANYKKAIASGDNLVSQNKFTDANNQYIEALKFKKNDPIATQKIADLEQKIKDEQANTDKKKKYDATITAADQLLATNKLTEAKAKYNEAIGIDASQAYPKSKISEIDSKIAVENKNKEKADKIATLLKDAGSIYAKNDLENAKKKYQEVLSIDSTNIEASTKINEIITKISANQSEKEKLDRFNTLKSKGNDLMKQQKWTEAKSTFLEAKSIKLDAEIDTKLKEIEAKINEENAKLNAEEQYKKILDEAKSLENKNIDAAILKYKDAQKIKTNDPFPTNKIKELDAKKAYNSTQVEIDKKYNDLMKKGNDAIVAKKYTEAIKFYNDALAQKPSEKEPVEKAAEAKKLSEEIANGEAFAQYQKILATGQKSIDEKNWEKAIDMFLRASKLDPDDIKPKNKLKEIEILIKADDDAKKSKLNIENTYKTKLAEAENEVNLKNYDSALILLNEAKNLMPTENFPTKRILEVKNLKTKVENSQNDKTYFDFITKGTKAFNNKDYTAAISEFKKALNIKIDDKQALAKISEAQQLIDNEKNNRLEQEFKKLLKDGDEFLKAEKYLEAKNAFEKALNIKNDFYAKSQYENATKKSIKQSGTDVDKQYQKIISTADNDFEIKNYSKAKELYERALSLKPTDKYPKDKLIEIDLILNAEPIKTIVQLKNLGNPSNEELAKVNEALIKAEQNRKYKNNKKISTKKNSIQDNASELNKNNEKVSLLSREKIAIIEKNNEENYFNESKKNKSTVEKILSIKRIKFLNDQEVEKFEYSDNINISEYVKNVKNESSNKYISSEKVYSENSESLKSKERSITNNYRSKELESYSLNIESQKNINFKKKSIDNNFKDDFDFRKITEKQVINTNILMNKNDYLSEIKKNKNTTNIELYLQKENKIRLNQIDEANKLHLDNSEEIKKIDSKILKNKLIQDSKFERQSLETDIIIAYKQSKIEKKITELDENRKFTVEILKSVELKNQENSIIEFNKNLIKHLKNQDELIANSKKSDLINHKELVHSKDIIDGIVIKTNNLNSAYSKNLEESNIKRQNTNDYLINSKINISSNDSEKSKKNDVNVSSIQSLNNDISSQMNKIELDKQQSLSNSQVFLDKLSSKEIKFDNKIANELGTLYPEGVSQEVFEIKDKDEFLIAVVTRRIVVKNGYGQIYVRTQTLNGITYSKNGDPTIEHIWQKETQDAKLPKNY
jgi:tetratricopeptide (TPR) repeat protein